MGFRLGGEGQNKVSGHPNVMYVRDWVSPPILNKTLIKTFFAEMVTV